MDTTGKPCRILSFEDNPADAALMQDALEESNFLFEMTRSERLAAKLGPMRPEDLVFTSVTGGPVDHQNLANRHFKPAVVRAKLGAVRLSTTCGIRWRRRY